MSLLSTLQFEASREKDGGFFDLHSHFWLLAEIWAQDTPILVIVGSLCAIVSVLIIKTQRLVGVIGVASLSLWVFLGRGGQIIGFYLVPLLPLLALNVGLVLGFIFDRLKSLQTNLIGRSVARTIKIFLIGACLVGTLLGYTSSNLGFKSNSFLLWNGMQANAQQQAVNWVEAHLPSNSRIIIDQYMWTDLHNSYPHIYAFAHYYWKVQDDPAVRETLFHNDWRNVDYVVTTPQLLLDAGRNQMTLVEQAIAHSTVMAHFDTGGWPIDVRKVNKEEGQSLQGQSIPVPLDEMGSPRQATERMEGI